MITIKLATLTEYDVMTSACAFQFDSTYVLIAVASSSRHFFLIYAECAITRSPQVITVKKGNAAIQAA